MLEPTEKSHIETLIRKYVRRHAPKLAEVTNTYPHSKADDASNYEVDVDIIGTVQSADPREEARSDENDGTDSEGDSDDTSGSEDGEGESSDQPAGPSVSAGQARQRHTRVPVMVDDLGASNGIQTGTLVLVEYLNGNAENPVVVSVGYTNTERAPITEPGDWRVRKEGRDNATIEVIQDDSGNNRVNVGRTPEDHSDPDMGLSLDLSAGSLELRDGEGTGWCSNGAGEWYLNAPTVAIPGLISAGGRAGGPTAGAGRSTGATRPNWQSGTPYADLSRPDTRVVDLTDQLSPGDDITQQLQQNWKAGNTVILPAGEFAVSSMDALSFSGKNAELLGGGGPPETTTSDEDSTGVNEASDTSGSLSSYDGYSDADAQALGIEPESATVGTQAQVADQQTVINIPPAADEDAKFVCTGGGTGSVHIKNITLQGQFGKGGLKPGVVDRQSEMILEHVHLPDGNDASLGWDCSPGMFTGTDHSGTLYIRNCQIERFNNNGIYASATGLPMRGGQLGRILVEGGLYRNNNIANVRIGGIGSAIRRVVSITDSNLASGGGIPDAGRAFWVKDIVEAELVDNDVVLSGPGHSGIILGGSAEDIPQTKQSFVLNNNRVENNSDAAPVITVDQGTPTGSGNHISGGGDLSISGRSELSGTVKPPDADSPNTSPREV